MATIITFPRRDIQTPVSGVEPNADNILSLADWRSRGRALRTANGVFFVSNPWGSSGDAA